MFCALSRVDTHFNTCFELIFVNHQFLGRLQIGCGITHLVCKERLDIDEIPPWQWVLEGFDACVWVTRLLTNLSSLKKIVKYLSLKGECLRAIPVG